jgi:heme-degrading monooxygenase HmoA
MIARLWHGWTRPENADKYHNLLQSRILPEIHRINGYKGTWLMRRDSGAEVEFVTVTFWESREP